MANYVLDRIFMNIMIFVFSFTFSIIYNVRTGSYMDAENDLLNYIFAFIIIMFYFIFSEFLTGKTPAKFITGTKVVTEDGEKPNFKTILIRSLCRGIPFDAFSFIGSESVGWHDSLSRTKVIED